MWFLMASRLSKNNRSSPPGQDWLLWITNGLYRYQITRSSSQVSLVIHNNRSCPGGLDRLFLLNLLAIENHIEILTKNNVSFHSIGARKTTWSSVISVSTSWFPVCYIGRPRLTFLNRLWSPPGGGRGWAAPSGGSAAPSWACSGHSPGLGEAVWSFLTH